MATKEETFIQKFMESDLGRRIMAEAESEAAGQEERQAKAATLAALREGRAEFMATVQAELAEAEGRLKAARQALKEATANYNAVLSTTFGRQWSYDESIRQAESFLTRSAPARLKTALQGAQDRLERLRSRSIDRTTYPDIPSAVRLTESDRPRIGAVEERAREMAEATRQIENIKAEILGGQS